MNRGSILKGAFLLTAANLFFRLLSIFLNAFLGERIGSQGLGLLQLISGVGVFAALLGSAGVRVAAMCLTAEEFGKRNLSGVHSAMRTCLLYGGCLSTLAGLLLYALARPIAVRLLGSPAGIPALQVMGLTLPFTCLCGVMTGYYTACGRVKQLVLIELAERLLSLFFTLLLLEYWAGNAPERACCAVILGSASGCILDFILLYCSYRRDMKNAVGQALPMGRRLLHLCIPLGLNDILRAGLNTAEQLLIPYGLTLYSGSASNALGDYGVLHGMVFPLLMLPATLLHSLCDLLVPELSRSRVTGRRLRIMDLSDKCLRLSFLFACAVAGFFLCCGESLGLLLYGEPAAGFYLKCFAPMVLMLYLDAIADGMLKGMAEQIHCVRYNTLTSVLDVVFLFLLLPKWGIGGYYFTFLLTHGINLFLSLRRLLVVSRIPLPLKQLCPSALHLVCAAGLVCLLPTHPEPVKALVGKGLLFLALFFALCLLCSPLSKKDLSWLRRVLRGKKDGEATP